MWLPRLRTEGLGQIVLAVWVIFSVLFIANSIWQNFQANQVQRAAATGYQQAVVDLIQQADTCQEFPINLGDKVIKLKKVDCAEAAAE